LSSTTSLACRVSSWIIIVKFMIRKRVINALVMIRI
jgi:hypothetical protein